MKRIITATLVITPIVFVMYFLLSVTFRNKTSYKPGLIQYDTLWLKSTIENGDKLKNSNPDSSVYYYKKIININSSEDSIVQHYKGLAFVGLANAYCNLGKYEDSEICDSIAFTIGRQINDEDIQALAENLKGLVFYKTGNFEEALNSYGKSLKLASKAKDRRLEAKVYTNTGIIYYLQGNCKKATENFTHTLNLALLSEDREVLAGTYMNLGLTYYNEGDYQKAVLYYDKSLGVYEKINGKDGILLCYQNLGDIYFSISDFKKAFDTFKKSLQFCNEIGDKENAAKAHQNIGEVYFHLGDLKSAMDEYLISMRIKEKIGDKQGMTSCLSAIGALHCQQKNYRKALDYYKQALKINEELKLVKGMASNYANIASVCMEEDQPGQSFNYFQKALDLYKSIEYKSGVSEIYVSLGSLFRDKNDFKRAEKYLTDAIQQKTSLKDIEGIAMTNYELAVLYFDIACKSHNIKDYKKAIFYGLKSYEVAKNLQLLPIVNKTCNVLKNAYKESGDYNEALKFSDCFEASSDSLLNKSKLQAITLAEIKWNVEKKQKQIEKLKIEEKLHTEIIAKKDIEAKRQKLLIYGSISMFVFSLVLVTLAAFYVKNRRDIIYQKQLANIAKLKMQNARNRMSPHFFFNLLSSISAHIDQPAIKEKLKKVSLLLRKSLENIEQTAIPLEEEIDAVKTFIELQLEKLPEPFSWELIISNEVNMQTLLPAMMIQIPVENSIKHGLMPMQERKGKLIIRVENQDHEMKICIDDNGVGLSASAGNIAGTGTGLKVLLQTIHLLNSKNKNKILLTMNEKKEHPGTRVDISVPFDYSFSI